MRLILVTALLLAPAVLFASTPEEPAPAQAVAAPAPAAKEKKVCKLESGGTTSRMRKTVCRTVREWAGEDKKGTAAHHERVAR